MALRYVGYQATDEEIASLDAYMRLHNIKKRSDALRRIVGQGLDADAKEQRRLATLEAAEEAATLQAVAEFEEGAA